MNDYSKENLQELIGDFVCHKEHDLNVYSTKFESILDWKI